MKTKLFLLLAFALTVLMGMAQQKRTVTGVVTDKSGSPIPGARVELVGCNEYMLTELDGTFNFDTECAAQYVRVQYAGMQPKKKAISPNMDIQLSETNWWNAMPISYRVFVTAQAAFPDGDGSPAWGGMVGVVKDWGAYIKGVYKKNPSGVVDYSSSLWTTGNIESGYMAFTGGVVKRLGCALHLYLGAGYVDRQVTWELADGCLADYDEDSYSGAVIDCGLMLNASFLTVTGGIMYCPDGSNIAATVGIGINF